MGREGAWNLRPFMHPGVAFNDHCSSRPALGSTWLLPLFSQCVWIFAMAVKRESCWGIVFFLFACLFRTAHSAYGSCQAKGQIGVAAAGLHHSHSNTGSKPCLQPIPQLMDTGSLTYWAKPGFEPVSSWILVFVITEPQWELLVFLIQRIHFEKLKY